MLGKLSFPEYAIEWDIRMEEATTRAGLEINDVGKFHLFFRNSGLPNKFVEDIKLQLQGDLRRFQEARALALRLVEYYDDSWQDYGDGYEYGQWYGEEDEDGEEWYSPEKEGYIETSNAAASGTNDAAPGLRRSPLTFPCAGALLTIMLPWLSGIST